MKVEVFAVLKDHFDKKFDVNESIATPEQLRSFLIRSKPEAKDVLGNCRFVVNDEFVEMNFKLNPNDSIVILPPSSGG